MILRRDMPYVSKQIGDIFTQQQQAENEQALAKLRDYLGGQASQARQQQSLEMLQKLKQDPQYAGLLNQGGGVSINPETGAINAQGNPYARIAAQGPHQAQTFLKNAQAAYKGITDQLDASQSTLDALNQKNAASDKLALISEARLAAGAGGSRAIKGIMDSLSGGRTAGMDYQSALNYISNTPNIPTMQDAQRDAIRESVFNRLPQIESMHHQALTSLAQQGPIIAPQADTGTLINSLAGPADQKLSALKKMQSDYVSARAKQGPSDVSQPGIANPNPSTLDKLRSLFSGLGGQSAPQSAPTNDPGYQRYQQLLQKAGMGGGQ